MHKKSFDLENEEKIYISCIYFHFEGFRILENFGHSPVQILKNSHLPMTHNDYENKKEIHNSELFNNAMTQFLQLCKNLNINDDYKNLDYDIIIKETYKYNNIKYLIKLEIVFKK
jgi:hypothetical protein